MISIIIPAHNESAHLQNLLPYLRQHTKEIVSEIIVVSALSTDDTPGVCNRHGVTVLECGTKNRAVQMNLGAAAASYDILYFLHADTKPPGNFVQQINDAFISGYNIGRYKTKFEGDSFLLKLNAFFTRFDILMCYGGDQTLFITKELFNKVGGFTETLAIMEDYDITERARENGRYIIMDDHVLVSTRKYNKNSWLQVQKANYKAVKMYRKGVDSKEIARCYTEKINR